MSLVRDFNIFPPSVMYIDFDFVPHGQIETVNKMQKTKIKLCDFLQDILDVVQILSYHYLRL